MPLPFQYPIRLLIPIWRRFSDTQRLQELDSSGNSNHQSLDITEVITDWNDNKTPVTASEIINAAITTRNFEFPELQEARTLLENSGYHKKQDLILKLIKRVTQSERENTFAKNNASLDLLLEDIRVDNIGEVWSRLNTGNTNQIIHQLRNLAHNQVSNPIIWVEMARLYFLQGQNKKAERAMNIALELSPDNKFILRSATSLFVNLNDSERALHYLRKSSRTKNDPWLISAHIAASRTINRYSPLIKSGINIITSQNFSEHNITELASSIGTEEYNSGGIKKARNFFNIALKKPNDNTLAQIEWISQDGNQFNFDPRKYKNIIHSFEAAALDALEKGLWEDALINGLKWFFETPYHKQSIYFCIFILDLLFDKHQEAIEFCKAGLKIYPNDAGLVNNMVYLQVMANNHEGFEKNLSQFAKKNPKEISKEKAVNYLATLGLVNFRVGKIDEGIALYQNAIKRAEEMKNEDVANIAFINLTREVFIADLPNKNEYFTKLGEIRLKTDSILIKAAIDHNLIKLRKLESQNSKNI